VRTTTTAIEERFARLERIAVASFVGLHGDRGYPDAVHQRYPCPASACEDGLAGGQTCSVCQGRGDVPLKVKACFDIVRIFAEEE
jgi:hypothetical protein